MPQETNGWGQQSLASDQSRPAHKIFAVTPADGTDLPNGPCRALRIGTAGNIAIIARENSDAQSIILPVGALEVVSIQTRRVLSTGTTATGIVALY